ncbi:hypothetical protein M441DRAFT_348192 [Trichoderma asperellum CBS 433.97]|uniref:Uncharacterized protein n=1 Tax=Trichoderma asperellum (strain ATCC 204424 / CBS 433.97 / NBRC 101777) TaxID=1042311 RepID=A0A2T3ZHW8_TRIA4|nr:hypothetical protein M441DRAFT_348192 [Trichoderma asperellum CBS 433.97]PTB44396.1 hypothetical protein M441DRAFT_348192 [Trichoderma asperellum CBS 433.97]
MRGTWDQTLSLDSDRLPLPFLSSAAFFLLLLFILASSSFQTCRDFFSSFLLLHFPLSSSISHAPSQKLYLFFFFLIQEST